MKRTKRILAILMAVVMALSLAACKTSPTPDSSATPPPADTTVPAAPTDNTEPGFDYTGGLPDGVVTKDPITLKAYQWALGNQSTDFANLWYYQKLQEDTNVTIDWTVVKEDEWNTQLNLMFISGAYPDLIIRPNQNLNIEEYGVTQQVLIPLDGYIQANMPNYTSRLSLNNVTDSMISSDGKMYSIGYLVAQNINHNAHFFINQTWLDTVGKQIPKTIDELTDVLKAFRDQKPGGEGSLAFSAAGGIEHQTQGIYTYFGMFGVPLQRWIYACIDDNDKVYFPGYMDGFREACEWLSQCYADGLLDKEALTQDENSWNAKVNDNKIGFQTYLRLNNSAWANPETIQNWVSILPPATSRGALVPRELEVPEFGAVLTTANQHVPETLRWLDAQFDTQRMLEAANGPSVLTDETIALLGEDGKDLNEDGTIDAPLAFSDNLWSAPYVPGNNALYKLVPVTQGQFFAPGDYYFNVFSLPPHRIERRDYAAQYQAAGIVEKNSYMILTKLVRPTADEATERSRMFTAIETFMKEKISTFITGGVDDAKWQAFMEEAQSVGVEDYITLNQKLYDEYLTSIGK